MNIKRKFQMINIMPVVLAGILIIILASSFMTVWEGMKIDRIGEQIVIGVFDLNVLTNEYITLLHPSERPKNQWFKKHDSIGKLFDRLEFEGTEERELMRKLRRKHQLIREHFLRLVGIYEAPEGRVLDEYHELIKSQLLIVSDSMVSDTELLSDLNYKSVIGHYERVAIMVVSSILLLLVIMVIVSVLTGRSILKPILRLRKATGIIAGGDLDHRTGISTSDEIGGLAQAFDDMTLQLKKSRTKLEDEIAERRKAEQSLTEQRQRLFSLLDALPAFVYLQAPDYSIRFANKYYREHFGETEGKPCYQSMWGRNEPCEVCPTFKVFETRQPQVWEWDAAPDGRIYEINDHHFIDIDGLELVCELGIDITERKKAEQALHKEKEKLQKYLDISAVMVVMLDADQKVTLINKKGCDILGCVAEDVIGVNWFDNFLPQEVRDEVQIVFNTLMTGEIEPVQYYENEVLTRSGEKRLIAWYNTVFRDEDGRITNTLGAGVDITDSRNAEMQIKASLREKEVLMREIHHRVKNNMAVISSLLKMQADKLDDSQYREMFYDSIDRIKSMARIHEKLYRSRDMAEVDFGSYLEDIVASMFKSYRMMPGRIALKTDVGSVRIGIDDAIPLGLITNELLTNSLKHAFPGDRKGEVKVSLREVGERDSKGNKSVVIELVVSDNGIGLPEDLDFRKSESLGMNLITALARQIRGKVELNREAGTEFRITFQP